MATSLFAPFWAQKGEEKHGQCSKNSDTYNLPQAQGPFLNSNSFLDIPIQHFLKAFQKLPNL